MSSSQASGRLDQARDGSDRDGSARDGSAAGIPVLVERLVARADDTGGWSLSSDELIASLGLEAVRFWRSIHDLRNRICFSEAIDGFCQDTVGDLVTVLEDLAGPQAEEALARSGLFIPHETGVELTERLLRHARRFAATHEVHGEELEAMIRHAGSVRGAIGIYADAYADLEVLLAECAESWRASRGMSRVGAATARRYLRRLFERHILSRAALLAALEARLRLVAAERGFTDPEEGAKREERTVHPRGRGGREWALGVMGLRGEQPAGVLRARYRQLMMRHHPDVDPASLERCKDINVAYALLIAEA